MAMHEPRYQLRPVRSQTQPKEGWVTKAECRDTDPELFFPEHSQDAAAEAMRICGRCPVKGLCLNAAMKAEGSRVAVSRFGIFGGTLPQQRAYMYEKGYRA